MKAENENELITVEEIEHLKKLKILPVENDEDYVKLADDFCEDD